MTQKTLILMRHGKSDHAAGVTKDFDRPLNKRGRSDVPAMAAWLADRDLVPELIVSSPAKRARETAELAAGGMALAVDAIEYDSAIYEADRRNLVDVVGRHGTRHGRLLIIGHNPALDELLSFLVTGSLPLTRKGKLMTTAAVAVLQCDHWQLQRGSCRLRQLMRPKQLP